MIDNMITNYIDKQKELVQIEKAVKNYVEHQGVKMHKISMAALVAKANILKVLNGNGLDEYQIKYLKAAIDDLKLIQDNLTREDFKL
jgi:hypothetical protein